MGRMLTPNGGLPMGVWVGARVRRGLWLLMPIVALLALAACGESPAAPTPGVVAPPRNNPIPASATPQAAPATPAASRIPAVVLERDGNGNYFKGLGDSPVVLEEWNSLDCPACGAARPVVERLALKYRGAVKVVFRHLPLVQAYPRAIEMAESAEAAGDQGAFWPMVDALYLYRSSAGAPLYETLAYELGLDVTRVRASLQDHRYRPRVDSDVAESERKRLTKAPAFFVDGRDVSTEGGSLYGGLESALREALASRAPNLLPSPVPRPTYLPTTPVATPTRALAGASPQPAASVAAMPPPVSNLPSGRDAQGHYYKGSVDAKVVLEEWSDIQ